jgi:hypothetical protein
MRLIRIVGLVLVVLGILGLLGKLDFSRERGQVEIGEFRASFKEKQPIPPWAGVLAIVAGVGLVAAGGRRKD